MASSSIISFDMTMRQPMLYPISGQAVNRPLRACSLKICSSPLSDLRRTPQHLCPGPAPAKVGRDPYQHPPPPPPPWEDGLAPTLGDSSKDSARNITPGLGQAEELVAVIGPPSPETDWRKPITDYLQLGMIQDDETETWCLARRAKGYLIHNNELYRCNALGILQWCIPLKRASTSPQHPWRDLRASRLLKEHGRKGLTTRILLPYRS
jgi:hypothetical protein